MIYERTESKSEFIRLLAMLAFMLSLFLYGEQRLSAQHKPCDELERSSRRDVKKATEHPALSIDYSRGTKFKLALRKTTYHMDEMIHVDVAMLNTTDEPLFLPKPVGNRLTLYVQNDKGETVKVEPYAVENEGLSPDQFEFLMPAEMISGSRNLLAGCNSVGLADYFKSRDRVPLDMLTHKTESLDQGTFEQNVFVDWGEACIRFTGSGTYTITAELRNDYIVVSPCDPKVRTAVGTIRSAPLKFTIVE